MNKQEQEIYEMTVVRQFAYTLETLARDPQSCRWLTELKEFRNLLIRVDEYAARRNQALR